MGPNKFPVLSIIAASPADQTNRVNQFDNRSGKRLISCIIVDGKAILAGGESGKY